MKWLNCEKIRFVLVVFVVVVVLGGGIAKADFTFGEPTLLGPTINTGSGAWSPRISSDGLSLYFGSERPGGYGRSDIWVSTRPTTEDNWSEPVNLGPAINGTGNEWDPSISTDELELYFDVQYSAIYVSRRESTSDPWDEPVLLPYPISGSYHSFPCISADGLELYYSAIQLSGQGDWYDIYVVKRTTKDDPWQEPIHLNDNVNRSACNDNTPNISADGLVLFFRSGNRRPGGYGYSDIWMSRRATVSDPWQEAVNLGPMINSPHNDWVSSVSSDGSMLYFDSDRPGGPGEWNIWQAPIVPIVDFNGDGCVDILDLVILIENWGSDESLCDIGPMPWGDGIVDESDLNVLMSYWGNDIEDPTLMTNYKLDEAQGDIACDSADILDGILNGNPTWQPVGGIVDGALEFDGIDDYISTPFILNPGETSAFSVFAWIKGGLPGQTIISQTDGLNWLAADSAEGCLMTNLKAPTRDGKELLSQVYITDEQWHRIGLVWDGSERILYVDDIEAARDAQTVGLAGFEGGLYIGAGSDLEPGSFFCGLIDDVRIYNRAITP